MSLGEMGQVGQVVVSWREVIRMFRKEFEEADATCVYFDTISEVHASYLIPLSFFLVIHVPMHLPLLIFPCILRKA